MTWKELHDALAGELITRFGGTITIIGVNTIHMTEPTDMQILFTMKKYGGGFASKLAEAGLYADVENLEKIKNAWPEYWKRYTEMAEQFTKQSE